MKTEDVVAEPYNARIVVLLYDKQSYDFPDGKARVGGGVGQAFDAVLWGVVRKVRISTHATHGGNQGM
jgi:hypothetical protein